MLFCFIVLIMRTYRILKSIYKMLVHIKRHSKKLLYLFSFVLILSHEIPKVSLIAYKIDLYLPKYQPTNVF